MKRLYSILCLINLLIRAYSACSDGYYPIDQNKCAPCPDGHYCPKNQQPIECPTGSVSFSDIYKRVNCATCSDGYYQDQTGQSACKVCPSGHFCLDKKKKVECPVGTVSFSDIYKRISCAACSDGYYQDQTGQSACKVCPPGHFCPSPDLALKCPKGTVSFSDIYKRVKCTGCSDGYYQKESGSGACNECPPGHFCPTPDLALPCPKGTVSFSDIYKRTECAQCSDGYYQDLTGQIYCKQCPVGHYCPNPDSSPIPCPIGTVSYSDVYKRTSCSRCSGSSCSNNLSSTCLPGYFVYNTFCTECPFGHFCPIDNNTPQSCPEGTVNHHLIQHRTSCLRCNLGRYRNSTNGIYDASSTNCINCPLGHYCPTPDKTPIRCPAGSVNYLPYFHRQSCIRLSFGRYHDKAGGIYDGSYSDSKICPLGHFCPSPELSPQPCPPGTVNHLDGLHRVSCNRCPLGYYQPKDKGINDGNYSDCKRCPSGHFCPSPENSPIKCPANTYSNSGSTLMEHCV